LQAVAVEGEDVGRRDEEDRAPGEPGGQLRVSAVERLLPHQDRGLALGPLGMPEREAADHSLSFSSEALAAIAIPSWASWRGSTSEGAAVIRSVALAVLGKAMTSRIEGA